MNCSRAMGSCDVMAQNGGSLLCSLNNSVLNRMSRDCTEPPSSVITRCTVQVRLITCIPYKIMSLVRKSVNGVVASTAPELLPLALAAEEGFDLIENADRIAGAVSKVRNTIRTAKGVVKSINDSISGGSSRPQVAVSQQLVPSSSSEPLGISKVPVAMNKKIVSKAPQIRTLPGGMRVSHRELVTSIEGSVNWAESHYMELNPGLTHCFPWLSSIAKNFQQYRPCGPLKLEFVPNVATTQSGAIYISPNYVADGNVPDSEAEAANLDGTVSGSIWAPLSVTLNQKALLGLGPRKFVRTDMESGDMKTFDMGFIQVSVVGCADTTVKGRLFVTYDIEFFAPIVSPSGLGDATNIAVFTGQSGVNLSLPHATSTLVLVPTQVVNGIRAFYSSGSFALPRGRYLLTFCGTIAAGTLAGTWGQVNITIEGGSGNRVDGRDSSTNYQAQSTAGGWSLKFSDNFFLEINSSDFMIAVKLTMTCQGGSGSASLLNDAVGSRSKVIIQLL